MLDGTISQTGCIWHQVQLTVLANGHPHSIPFLVCPIGNTPAILGMTWLTQESPLIDWSSGTITFLDLVQIASKEEANPDPLADLPPQYHEFARVFGEEEFKVLPPHQEYDIAIDFLPDAKLTPGPIYRMTDAESKALKQHIDEELATGKICPSTSLAGAPVIKLNNVTHKNVYPLPRQDNLMAKLQNAKLFTKLDLHWGYNNVRIKEGDEWKTAFRTKYGLFEYLVMPFGITNAPAAFQHFMNDLFRDLIDVTVVIYLDDILIFLEKPEEHPTHAPLPHAVFNIPSTRSGVPHPYSRPSSRSSRCSIPTHSQPPSCVSSPTPRDLSRMEPEPTTAALLEAITALTATVGSLQAQITSQGQQLIELKAICKETANLLGDKDQGAPQAQPGPLSGPVTPPTHTEGETHTPGTVRPGLKAPFRPSRGTGFDSKDKEEPRRPKKEPQGTPRRHLGSLTPFNAGSSVKRPKMDLPKPFKGNTRGRKATQWLDRMMLWGALHRDQFDEEEQMVVWILYHMTNKAADWALPIIGNIIKGEGNPPTTIQALTAKFKEAFADPNAKRAAARKIAVLSQTTTTSEYVTEFRNLMAELDWNKEAYIAQFTRGLHWKVKELLSTKDSVPDELKAIFAASIKIDNIRRKNEENRPKKAPAKSPATVATSTTTTRVRLSEDPNYVTPEERDRHRASGLCVKCGQKGHGIKQCPNGWKATIKEVAKVAEEEGLGKD
ncbi:Reverse transcriptase (RNA-dependent DNA polymerase) [Rhizoctonia solani]|uniref:Reverse transcriptase (RNA-dependent DNA polymerase) n=1 Tax=Rhizoctonia solani TaxID=456999 RepID=A0A8H8NX78_9AGAM|nr:Reverse transcriptase (RNA-dependent DNA polymerase) [Rhizoctonia solani]QRW21781.1 Reverse transcriptase (RNA-dependent DNA polymerase) [Rhizoctonia solani]